MLEASAAIPHSFAAALASPDAGFEEVAVAEEVEAKVDAAPDTAEGAACACVDAGADARLETTADGPPTEFDCFRACLEERDLSGRGRLSCASTLLRREGDKLQG